MIERPILGHATPSDGLNLDPPLTSQVLLAGLEMARSLGAEPIVALPSAAVGKVGPDMLAADAGLCLSPSNGAGVAGREFVLLFPGGADALERAIQSGYLVGTPHSLVLENGHWRQTVAARPRRPQPGRSPGGSGWLAELRQRHGPRAFAVLRTKHWARRLQPFLDRREEQVLSTLLDPGHFPYRVSRAVEKRVVLAISSLSSGGAERQIINTAEALRAQGVDDTHILVEHLDASTTSEAYRAKARRVAASVQGVPDTAGPLPPWVSEHPGFRRALTDHLSARVLSAAAVISRLSPEIVQASLDWTNITIGLAAVLAGVPKVLISGRNLSPRHFEFFQWFMYPCYRALARCPDVVLLNNSEAGKGDYCKWLRLTPSKITVLRNGLHRDDFPTVDASTRSSARAKLGLAADVPIVTGAFRLSSEKRPLLWIDTAARIKAALPDTNFLLCGVGPLAEAVKARASSVGLGRSLHLLGSRGDIGTILAASNVVMQTSLQEGTPNVLIEAQASGIPVVTTPAFGAAEAVDDGVTGLVVDVQSARRLAQAVVSILKDRAVWARTATVGPQFIEQRFGFDRMAADTLTAFADAGVAWASDLLPAERRYAAYARLANIHPDGGKGWVVPIPDLEYAADSAADGRRSPLILFEDDVALGPAHTPHDALRRDGNGRYSHWGTNLYFSTSDGTDPNVNGRRYAVAIPRGAFRRDGR